MFENFPEDDFDSSTLLVVIFSPVYGQVSLLLESFFQPTYFEQVIPVEMARKLCNALSCFCLISDNDVNPYSMFKVNSEGAIEKFFLNAEEMNDHNRYVI